ncbi:MAG: helix-turn-helix transcriptional regulator [Lachnospiraceae bacterium]|nr:helix-turn-helix transcriptional regulator [Lachnospiraceae bacterium]
MGDRFRGCIIQSEKNQILILLYYRGAQDFDADSCKDNCEEVIRYASQTLGCDTCIFVGHISPFRELRASIDHINGMAFNIVAYYNQVFFADSHVIPPLASVMPDTDKWSRMLLTMHPEILKKEIRLYFQQMTIAGAMDGRLLSMFREDTIQMIYSLLRERDINAHEFTYDAKLQALSPEASESADNMLAFTFRAIDLVAELLKEKTVSVTEQAREYIDMHCTEDITREEIAARFFLHPDYLDRICKKDFGCTVRQMIMNARIENACRLLLETKVPVSSIASRSGFKSPAHFSMIFKKETGQTPKEYRQNEGRKG